MESTESPESERKSSERALWPALIFVLLVGAALRLPMLDAAPPGLWFDEALNLQDAAGVAKTREFRLVYPDEFPREPMFVTLLAGATMAFGPDYHRLRIVPVALGLLAILALFFCVRELSDAPTAFAAAGTLAAMRWHAIFSRLFFRTVLVSLWIPLIVLAALWTRRNPTFHRASVLGALIGLGFYTYLSWYFFLPGIFILLLWAFHPLRSDFHAYRRTASFCVITALLVASPLFAHYKSHPDHFFARPGAVSPLKADDPAGELIKNTVQMLGMFHWSGDHVPKHNLPRLPALDPLQGLFMIIGLIVCARGAMTRDPASLILLAWLTLGVAPTIFAITDSPNFLRTLGATPAVAAIVGIGIIKTVSLLSKNRPNVPRTFIFVGTGILIIISAAASGKRIYLDWSRSAEVWESFNGPMVEMAEGLAAEGDLEEIWAPAPLTTHRSVRYILDPFDQRSGPTTRLYETPAQAAGFLPVNPGRIRVLTTAQWYILPQLEQNWPSGEVTREFKAPAGNTYALIYEFEVSEPIR